MDFDIIKNQINNTVSIAGWVKRIHNLGGYIFVDLMNNNQTVQCVFEEKPKISVSNVVSVTGVVTPRPAANVTKDLYGDIDIIASDYKILSQEEPLAFPINSNINVDSQLLHRTLYMRGNKMQNIIRKRHKLFSWLRNYMNQEDFIEIQTPILTKSSPEGARDYLVLSTSRNDIKNLSECEYYALPQSPQLWKQTIMACGFEKYYQIAPCFRDEAGRSDRHTGEFYQLDFEMAFATREKVLSFIDKMLTAMIEKFSPRKILKETMSYADAMRRYGCDKPDLRRKELENMNSIIEKSDCNILKNIINDGGFIKSIELPIQYKDQLLKEAKALKINVGYIFRKGEKYGGTLAKFLDSSLVNEDSVRFFSGDIDEQVASQRLYQLYKLVPINNDQEYSIVYIIDFPMYEENDGKIEFMHNPCSSVYDEKQEPLKQKANQYDCALNGYEILSGGIREHRIQALLNNFKKLGYTEQQVRSDFLLFNTFKYGVPPHGGAAFGLERLMMILFDANLYDVIPFPLNNKGKCMISQCPNIINWKDFQ